MNPLSKLNTYSLYFQSRHCYKIHDNLPHLSMGRAMRSNCIRRRGINVLVVYWKACLQRREPRERP